MKRKTQQIKVSQEIPRRTNTKKAIPTCIIKDAGKYLRENSLT